MNLYMNHDLLNKKPTGFFKTTINSDNNKEVIIELNRTNLLFLQLTILFLISILFNFFFFVIDYKNIWNIISYLDKEGLYMIDSRVNIYENPFYSLNKIYNLNKIISFDNNKSINLFDQINISYNIKYNTNESIYSKLNYFLFYELKNKI
uniref:hypothetical protein n=1 Tax=Meteora sporadica TaxID=2913902 RepID=UPI003002FF7E|nr:hypothetical protein [Meteora sporadica]